MISNYSCPCDRILTSDRHDPVYDIIAEDLGRSVECFSITDEDGSFDASDLEYKVSKLLRNQEHLLVILDMKPKLARKQMEAIQEVVKKIIRITNDDITIRYEVD